MTFLLPRLRRPFSLVLCILSCLCTPAYARPIDRFIEQLNQQDNYSILSQQHSDTTDIASTHLPTSSGGLSVHAIEQFLNRITTMSAEFEQTASTGESSTGRFYLSRPGKLRWEYDPPVPLILVMSGHSLTILDRELDQLTHGKTDDHLTSLLIKAQVNLQKDTKILHLVTNSGFTRITLTHPKNPETGTLTLVFQIKPLSLVEMEMEDAQHMHTHVRFTDIVYGSSIDQDLFILKDPRIFKHKNRD